MPNPHSPKRSRFIFLLLFAIMPMIGPGLESPSSGADAGALATVAIKITGMRNHHGDLIFGIFTSADGFPTDKAKSVDWQVKPADADTVTFTAKLAPGKYGASVLHDENRNGKMDKSAIGVPLEGYGVTNNPKPRFRAATFAESRFVLPAAGATLTIEIQYF
ncbi:MAG TPA: DUF2141 domain-containing protein [Humisphaera sp.]|nr:DUF2141 domain-containing protein [Humisphaera sp.]